jgi:hypothetical protein
MPTPGSSNPDYRLAALASAAMLCGRAEAHEDAVLPRALNTHPDDGQPSITSTEGLEVKSESGSSTRSW